MIGSLICAKIRYLIDVAGWYEITSNESAVASLFDLTIEDLKALPPTLGRWTGTPYDIGPGVNEWFENPEEGVWRSRGKRRTAICVFLPSML